MQRIKSPFVTSSKVYLFSKDWQNLENFIQNAEAVKERRMRNLESLREEAALPLHTYQNQFQVHESWRGG
jgi:hypothetical protein